MTADEEHRGWRGVSLEKARRCLAYRAESFNRCWPAPGARRRPTNEIALRLNSEEPAALNKFQTNRRETIGNVKFLVEGIMATNTTNETPIRHEVERLFGEISAKRGDLCTNPVT